MQKECVSLAGQEKMQVQLPGASNFCSWVGENKSLVAQWESEIRLSSLVIRLCLKVSA